MGSSSLCSKLLEFMNVLILIKFGAFSLQMLMSVFTVNNHVASTHVTTSATTTLDLSHVLVK